MKIISEKAKEAVDKMVEEGLDCGAVMHKKIEKIVEEVLRQHEEDVVDYIDTNI